MKWFVYLFSFYVLLLSGVPCSADDDCCKDEISVTATPGNQTGHANHKPTRPCSPLFACGTCHGVVIPRTHIELTKVLLVITKLHYFYTEQSLRDFPPSIWQPPKIA